MKINFKILLHIEKPDQARFVGLDLNVFYFPWCGQVEELIARATRQLGDEDRIRAR